jgi:multiple sugar transport system permease protein
MLFNGNFPGSRFFKIAFYSPLVLAGTVIGVIWEAMYRPQDGLINSFLGLFGVEGPGWLADRNMVLWCIVFAAAWRQVGYIMILYLAGLKGLDVTLIEASRVDGANGWERFLHVVFPLLGPVTVVVMVISVIDSLRAFDLVAIMTRGGPAYSSEVLANFMYMQAFNNYRMGYAGTIAVVILGLMLVFIIPYLARTARTELEY